MIYTKAMSNEFHKLVKNKNVDITTIDKLCNLLDCQPGEILEYVPDDNINDKEE